MMTRDEARAAGRKQLGDRIEQGLKAIGAHQAIKAIERRMGWDCGCARRRDWLNKIGR